MPASVRPARAIQREQSGASRFRFGTKGGLLNAESGSGRRATGQARGRGCTWCARIRLPPPSPACGEGFPWPLGIFPLNACEVWIFPSPACGKHWQDCRRLQKVPGGRAIGTWRVQGAEGGWGANPESHSCREPIKLSAFSWHARKAPSCALRVRSHGDRRYPAAASRFLR